ncbi:hypothetical protein JZ751_005639 [Albula glossodonta]|uniref:HECT-type E3 ubiquitin transferase n=1 Tax=Albula glossodonta TaxID=121402 RepID=A0A8T2N5H1_9TELE|nr:hypothetical protein JZ751_005639 [Albula glossodonta]
MWASPPSSPPTATPPASPSSSRSVLAFVLDHLLPHTQNSEDKDTPALARLFLASLAAAGTGTDAQVALVNEVKAALSRALAMAESTEKHARLQAVMCIISTIMESCPSTSSFYSTAAAKTQHNGMNNIIRLFLKKGLVNDLARVPHSLDLSSPNMANTVNAALKPLETLSRIVNQPSSLFGGKGGSSKSKAEHDTAGAARDSTSNTQDPGDPGEAEPVEGSGPAQGPDSDLMDGETEGDSVVIAGRPEVLGTQEMQVENELVDLIDELLERDAGTVNSTIIVGRSGEDESQEDVLMDEAPSINLSQASTLQANREDSMNILEPEDEEHTQEEDSSGSNEDEDSQDEEEEEEEEEEDDQDDEEGDEDDDDEGSEMELDEDYPDINAAPHIRFERFDRDDDLIIEFDNMFSTTGDRSFLIPLETDPSPLLLPSDIPPSPGNIPSSHPLMVRHADHGSLTLGGGGASGRLAQGMGRSQRTLRQLTANTGHTIHVHYPGNRQPNPPLILQRLLGPSAAADILQLSSSLPLQSRGRARLLVGNEDVHIIARSDDELLDDFFQEQSTTGGQAGTLSSIPTALTRWTDECKVLDAESMHDCVAVVKVPILQHLESLRDEELEERREKRRRQLVEEEETKQNEKSSDRGEENLQNLRAGGGVRISEQNQSESLSVGGVRIPECGRSQKLNAVEESGSRESEMGNVMKNGSELRAVNGPEQSSAEGEQGQCGVASCLDPPRVSEGFLTAPPSGEATPTTPAPSHQPALVSLETAVSQQVHQPIADLLVAESHADSLVALAGAGLPEMSAPDRPNCEVEASQMEMSPAPTIASLSPEQVGVSQLEGSPMDTSSPASATQEDSASIPAQASHTSQELPGGGASAQTDRQTDAEGGSVSTTPRNDSTDSQSQAIQEEPLPSTSNEEEDPLAGISLPEGVDPSFLAALPEDIRREVLQNQLGIRPPSRPPAAPTLSPSAAPVLGTGPGVTEVSPEFLAALPPAIQEEVREGMGNRDLSVVLFFGIKEPSGCVSVGRDWLNLGPTLKSTEVLAQQRAEQQRRELSQQPPQGDQPLDPVTFIQTLPSELRRSVLEEMEDSVLAVMPPDIAAEAAALRREQEARQRQLMHERLFGHSSSSALSAILRSPAFTNRLGGNRGVQYTRLAVQRGGPFPVAGGANHSSMIGRSGLQSSSLNRESVVKAQLPSSSSVDSLLRLRGRLLLDHEALSCLLVLLFVDEPRLNTSRLHRVLRNLCYHSQTRGWVICSLLSILQRSSESELCIETPRPDDAAAAARGKRAMGGAAGAKGSASSSSSLSLSSSSSSSSSLDLLNRVESRSSTQLSWLSVSMDAALGCRTNIFQIQRAAGRKHADRHSAGATCGAGGPGGGATGAGGGTGAGAGGVSCVSGGGSTVHIHPQAAPVVCRHVLDTLIQLAKEPSLCSQVFPSHFTQQRCKDLPSSSELDSRLGSGMAAGTGSGGSRSAPSSQTASVASSAPSSANTPLGSCVAPSLQTPQSMGVSTDFWDLLVKLDNMNVSRKGKASMKTLQVGGAGEAEGAQGSLEASPLGQLMNMLSHPVIRRSSLLTEKLLRLLSLISIALPDNKATEVAAPPPAAPPTATAAQPAPGPAQVTPSPAPVPTGPAPVVSQGPASGSVPVPAHPSTTTAVSTSTSTATTVAVKQRVSGGSADSDSKLASTGLTEKQLQLSVEVLTSHSCSEEGLEDAANILLQLSRGDAPTRDTVLRLLLTGARQLGYTLCKQIDRSVHNHTLCKKIDRSVRNHTLCKKIDRSVHNHTLCKKIDRSVPNHTLCRQIDLQLSTRKSPGLVTCTLLAELREYNLEQQRRAHADAHSPDATPEDAAHSARLKGKMTSRFDGAESVVIVAAQKRTLGGRELQLPSMSSLTSKTSTQKFFLRVLQVIIQLREDTRRANKKAKQSGRLGSSSLGSASTIQAAVRQLEAEADAIIQMVREGQRARRLQQAPPPSSSAAAARPPTPLASPQPAPPLPARPALLRLAWAPTDSTHTTTDRDSTTADSNCATTDRTHTTTDSDCALSDSTHIPTDSDYTTIDRTHKTTDSNGTTTDRAYTTTDSDCTLSDNTHITTDSDCTTTDRTHITTDSDSTTTDRAYITTDSDCTLSDSTHILLTVTVPLLTEPTPQLTVTHPHPTDSDSATTDRAYTTTDSDCTLSENTHITPDSDCTTTDRTHITTDSDSTTTDRAYITTDSDCTLSDSTHILLTHLRRPHMNCVRLTDTRVLTLTLGSHGFELSPLPPSACFRSDVQSVTEPPPAQRDDSPMDVDQPPPLDQEPPPLGGESSSQSEQEEKLPDLPLLSEQLLLDELWDMLGECLKELEESHDQHAVLELHRRMRIKGLTVPESEKDVQVAQSTLSWELNIVGGASGVSAGANKSLSVPASKILSLPLVLQPAVEAFFLVHATERESKPPVRDTRESQLSHIKDEPPPLSPAPLTPATPSSLDPFFSREPSSMHISANLPPDTQKFLRFAETHRTVLNQILRQSTTHLADGPFAVLVDYIRILDFDVKRKYVSLCVFLNLSPDCLDRYFRQELERLDEGLRKEDMAVHVRRDHVFEDSYRELHRKSPEEMKNRLYIVFEGEEGQDAGGLLREWYMIISREMFNPMYALFRTSPGDRVTYTINPSSHCNPNHLSYFKFVGRVVAKAVYDNRLLECYFTRSFYKHILGKSVRYTDMESEDYHFYQGLVYLLENDVSTLGYELTFSTEVQEFGVCEVRDLKPNGANILVTEENKKEYVHLVCQMKMTGAIRKQLAAFLEGFYEIIPKRLISIFTEQELELLISGLPTIDIDDLKANTEYHKYQSSSIQIQWFWRALRSFDQADRAKFLQFVTGTSKVPLQGFAALEGMNGIQKFQIHRDDRSTDRLPSAHTCFNQLDLPAYESYEKLRHMLLLAIQECSEGFGLA